VVKESDVYIFIVRRMKMEEVLENNYVLSQTAWHYTGADWYRNNIV